MAETPQDQETVMARWGAWYGMLGAAVVDGGAPFGASSSMSSSGAGEAASGLGGYTIVTAASMAAAADMAKGCPVIDDGGTVDIYDCIDMGM
jgi:hypothetical protein